MNKVELELDETLSSFEVQDWIDNVLVDRARLETPDIIKCAECGNIIDLPEAQIKRYCLHQENNYRTCLCVACTQKWKQTLEMANIKPSDLIYFGRKI